MLIVHHSGKKKGKREPTERGSRAETWKTSGVWRRLPRPKRVQNQVFTPAQARAFVTAADDHRLGPLFTVAMSVGLRLGEALGLRWSDVDFDARQLHVRQALQRIEGEWEFVEPKSERSRRTIALPDIAVKTPKRHRNRQRKERLKAGSCWNKSTPVVRCSSHKR